MKKDTIKGNESAPFAVVAVGASAGGLEAFSQLLRAIPNNTGMAFVFIQHLDPTHHSMLSELLAKASNMPVLEATNGTAVKPNHVYVIPPNVNMGISGHRLQLTPRDGVPGLHTPITERSAADQALQKAYERLESMVEERTAAVRQLSLKLLSVQDEEHRTIARELHDSLGQDLAAIKMDVQRVRKLVSDGQAGELVSKLSESLEKCIGETRTISHLLHPPLIDELGFVAAAKWYTEGFSERSGIKVNLNLSNTSQRMPRAVELPLFRILQATLSNVHRHAGSSSVDIRFEVTAQEAKLEVKDHGKGIDPELLKRFEDSGAGVGIGLGGMRERLRELGGRLEVESDANGTLIRALVPLVVSVKAKKSGSAV